MCKVKDFIVKNQFGIHARPATKFVSAAAEYESEVEVTNLESGQVANGRSIISMLMLNAPKGTRIRVKVDGKDQNDLIDVLSAIVESGFEE